MPPYISTGEIRTEKETTGTIWTEEMDSGLDIEVEQGTEGKDTCRQNIDRKEIRTGTHILSTQEYGENLDSPVGEELDFKQGDTLVLLLEHEENKHWWLEEDENGQEDICASAISHDHHRRYTPGRGKRHNQE